MRVLLALGRGDAAAWLADAVARLPAATAEVVLVHVVDLGPRQEWEQARERFVGRAPLSPDRRAALDEAERAGGEAILDQGVAAVRAAGYGGPLARQVLRGRPERTLVEAAGALGAGLVVLSAREGARPAPPGPRSVGHVARFVVDHAPCPVLLVRGSA